MPDSFPKPYVNDVPKNPEGSKMMEYTSFPTMGIGARRSGLPKGGASEGPKSLEHVGGSASGGKARG